MRWTVLYVRSRGIAATTSIALAAAAVLGLVAGGSSGFVRTVLALFAVTVVVSVAATSLAGHDPALERTAALDWRVRRTVHVVAVAGLAAGAVAAVPVDVVVRNAVGMTGLAALGVVVLGGGLAWCVPMVWTVAGVSALLVGPVPPAPVLTWPVQPEGVGVAAFAGYAVGVVGMGVYAFAGAAARS